MPIAIEFNNVSKLYRLGMVSSGTLSHDFDRWWRMKVKGEEDPFLKIGETNDRTTKGKSDYIWALKDIDFKVEQGDVVGIIGKNGAGKSTLLKILSKITSPTTGTIKANGRIGSLLEVGTGFHSELTGRENIYLNGAILGMTKKEIERKIDEIVDFSGCERYIDTPVKRYSSGMKMRLGFSVASQLDPEILVVDEVLAVGDYEFRKKAIEKMQELSEGEGRTVIFVSHNLSSIKQLCKTGIVLNNGMMDYFGTIEGAIDCYLASDKSNSSESKKPLDSNKNGNGALRFKDIRFFSKNGTERNLFEVGEECVIRISFDATNRLKQSHDSKISVLINDKNSKERVAWLSSTMFSERINPDAGMIQFKIPKLMLNQSIYRVDLFASVDGEKADFIWNAAQFETTYQDYFGTGRNPINKVSIVGNTFLDYDISWKEKV